MSPYAFYQFWLNRADEEVPACSGCSASPRARRSRPWSRRPGISPRPALGQRALAEEMTTLVHGADETVKAIAASRALFGQGDLAELDEQTLAAALAEVPSTAIKASPGSAGTLPTIAELMAETQLVNSRSAARRAIAGGGAYLNNRKVTEPDARPAQHDLLHGRFLVLRRGKRTVGGVTVHPEQPEQPAS